MIAGVAWLLALVAIGVGITLITGDERAATWLPGAGAIGFLIATIAALRSRAVTLAIADGTIAASWRGAPVRIERVELGAWVLAGVDTAIGVVAHVEGGGACIRIGGERHAGDGLELRAPPSRTVDCHLDAGGFDAVLDALGVRRGEVGPLVVPLVRSSQSAGALFRMMLPWLVTLVAVSVFGAVFGSSQLGQQLMVRRGGPIAIAAITIAMAVAGLVVTVVRARRVRGPELELRGEPDALVLARPGGDEIGRAAWPSLSATRKRYVLTSRAGSFTMPLLELAIGERTLRVGVWDTQLAWPDGDAIRRSWRGPTWLAGTAMWSRLVDELRRHHRI